MLRVARRAVGLALITAPLVSGYWRSVEHIEQMGEELGRWLPLLNQPLPLPSLEPTENRADTDAGAAASSAQAAALSPKLQRARKIKAAIVQARGRVLLISEQKVLALVQGGKVPQAVAVPAQAERPCGLQLSQISALGTGVQDGDVLFEVAGVPVANQQQVADLVRSARVRREHSIGARLWRGGETIALVVGMPYLDSPSASQR